MQLRRDRPLQRSLSGRARRAPTGRGEPGRAPEGRPSAADEGLAGQTPRRFRVLLSAYACAPDRGSEYAKWNWALALARRGHDVTVVTTPRFAAEIDAAVRRLPDPVPRFVFVPEPPTRGPLALLPGQQRVYVRYLAWQRAALVAATELHRERPFDLVHHVSWGSLQGGSHLGRLGVPFVFGPVGGGQVAPFRFLPWFGRSAVNELARTVLTHTLAGVLGHGRAVARRASIVLAVNRDTLDLARRLGSQRTDLFLESGIERSLLNERPDRDWSAPRLELLWVGRMFPRKGLRLGLEALARVPHGVPVHLTVLGDGPEAERLKRLAATLGVADRVTWRGRVPWDEVMRAMDRAHLLLFTSLRETFGAQLLEALARGLPVLTLDHHGAGDHVPDAAAIKVPVERPAQVRAALADAIERVAGDRGPLPSMSRVGVAWAVEQTWDAKAVRMESIYRAVVAASPTEVGGGSGAPRRGARP